MNSYIKEYHRYITDNNNPERAAKEKAYLYSELKHYGVSVWEMRKFAKFHKKELLALSKKKMLVLVESLWRKRTHEERSMALLVLNMHLEKLDIKDMPFVERLMRESNGWAFLDSLIIPAMPEIIRKDKRGYEYLKKWIKDKDYWVRRSALLAQLLFFRKNCNGDYKLFFKLAKSQLDESWIDSEYEDKLQNGRAKFFIRKAIGWSLREMSVKQPELVVLFVNKNKDSMAGLTYREATRKLPEEYKAKLI